MEEKLNNNLSGKEIIDVIKGVVTSLNEFENRLIKNEQLVLRSFSYLYSRQENLHYDENFHIIDNTIHNLQEQYSYISNQFYNLNNRFSEYIDNSKEEQKEKIPHKIKRPWHYFISKYFKYRRLLKERELLHEQQRIAREERLKKEEEEKLAKAEQERLEKIRQEEERKLREQERRKIARQRMNQILTNIK